MACVRACARARVYVRGECHRGCFYVLLFLALWVLWVAEVEDGDAEVVSYKA